MSRDRVSQINFHFLSKLDFKNILRRFTGGSLFKIVTGIIASTIFIILGLMFLKLFEGAWLSIKTYGIGFLFVHYHLYGVL